MNQILRFFPHHRRYVEPFGGSAAVLLNKPESYVEVFNDLDDDVVHFFRTVREQREALQEWLRMVPYSESVHNDWQDDFFAGKRPDDDIERAGRWFYLRYTTYGGSAGRRAGFKRPGKRNEARSLRGSIDSLDAVVERFQEVTIAKEDYQTVLDRYDHDETLFYLDPPYLNPGEQYYPAADDFDQSEFVDALRDRDGYWIVSAGDLPAGLRDVSTEVVEFTARYSLPNAVTEARQETKERLAMNFEPSETPRFAPVGQQTLEVFPDDQ
ncbi:DNA adenine methylase [Halocatena halophila]|uniref:DNA adenine methylase n=1 Tax=Halocatena halophila TaxID=2814576 RepID=UPI002ED17ADE